jgi:type II secretory pathway component HofQ
MDAAEYKHVVLGLIFLITRTVEEVSKVPFLGDIPMSGAQKY